MDVLLRNILTLLEQRGITDKQFQTDLGFYASAVSEWKNGSSKSYRKHLDKISAYFAVSADELLGNNYKNNPLTFNGKEITGRQKDYLDKIERMNPEQLKALEIFINALDQGNQ